MTSKRGRVRKTYTPEEALQRLERIADQNRERYADLKADPVRHAEHKKKMANYMRTYRKRLKTGPDGDA